MIFTATLKYITSQTKDYTWGGGDSVDRERVRDIILADNNLYLILDNVLRTWYSDS